MVDSCKKHFLRLANAMDSFRFSTKSVALIIGILFVCSLIPLFVMGHFAYADADDFSYGCLTHFAWESTHSPLAVLKAACQTVQQRYFSWQGTYAAIFLFSLQPSIYNVHFYTATTYILLGSLIVSTLFFLRTLLVHYLKMDSATYWILSLVTLTLQIQLMPDTTEAFYWYNGGIYYTFFYALMLLLFSCMLHFRLSTGHKKVVFAICVLVLSLLIGGGNYTTALLSCCLLVLFCLIFWREPNTLRLYVPALLLCLGGLLVSAIAPGNAVRQSHFEKSSPLMAILASFKGGLYFAGTWTTPLLLISLLFLAPFIWKVISRTSFSFSCPMGVAALSFSLFCAQLTPPLYAMGLGNFGGYRQWDHYYYVFVLMLLLNLIYLEGWSYRFLHKNDVLSSHTHILSCSNTYCPCCVHLFALIILLGFAVIHAGDPCTFSTCAAMNSLCNGEASTYAQEMEARYLLLSDPSSEDILLPQITTIPGLWKASVPAVISSDETDWHNVALARYYRKHTVKAIS